MTDEEKQKKKEKSWFEEFLYYFAMEFSRTMINYIFDEFLGWNQIDNYIDLDSDKIDWDEIEEWQF